MITDQRYPQVALPLHYYRLDLKLSWLGQPNISWSTVAADIQTSQMHLRCHKLSGTGSKEATPNSSLLLQYLQCKRVGSWPGTDKAWPGSAAVNNNPEWARERHLAARLSREPAARPPRPRKAQGWASELLRGCLAALFDKSERPNNISLFPIQNVLLLYAFILLILVQIF